MEVSQVTGVRQGELHTGRGLGGGAAVAGIRPTLGPLVHGCVARRKGALSPDAQRCRMAWHSWGRGGTAEGPTGWVRE